MTINKKLGTLMSSFFCSYNLNLHKKISPQGDLLV